MLTLARKDSPWAPWWANPTERKCSLEESMRLVPGWWKVLRRGVRACLTQIDANVGSKCLMLGVAAVTSTWICGWAAVVARWLGHGRRQDAIHTFAYDCAVWELCCPSGRRPGSS